MNASQEILSLLQEILNGECDRSSLARWLAENSLKFLESTNEVDGMIVADLDAALGEIQRGAETNEFLVEISRQLVRGLRLRLPDGEILVGASDTNTEITTGTANRGNPMAQFEVELVHPFS